MMATVKTVQSTTTGSFLLMQGTISTVNSGAGTVQKIN